jgi:diacylglycerol kinase family enzyme
MKDSEKIIYLLNPKSDEGRTVEKWKKATAQFPTLPKEFVDITKIPDLSNYIEDTHPDIIAIAGGDGTINAVCNAVYKLKEKPTLAVLPMGYGNALSYCFGVETMKKAIDVLQRRPHTVAIDIMQTSVDKYPTGIFNISAGFDARIVHSRTNYKYIGFGSFIISFLTSLIIHPEKEITFTIDHSVVLKATASSLVIANCPIIGQNYVVSPLARLNDGLLDCTLFSTKYDYMANLRLRGFKHPLYSELGKVHFKAKHITVSGEPFVQIDGDPIVLKEDIEISIAEKQITFLRNDEKHIDQYYAPFIL